MTNVLFYINIRLYDTKMHKGTFDMGKIKQFNAITEEEHKKIEEILIRKVNEEFRLERLSDNYFKYKVELQGIEFITDMSIDEIAESAKLTVDILEELKTTNNSGLNKSELKRIEKEVKEADDSEVTQLLGIWNRITTCELTELMYELDRVRRVDGAWAMLIANPCLVSAIYAVYDRMVDSFDDDKLYLISAYFLMRAVMRMNSHDA